MSRWAGHETENSKQHRKTTHLCVTVTKELRDEIEKAVASGLATTNSELIRAAVTYYLRCVKQWPSSREDEFEKRLLPGRR